MLKNLVITAYAFPIRHRHLIWQLVRREILNRYRGSILGLLWAVITPILMLLVYTSVFVGIFKLKWPAGEMGGGIEFAIQLFAGLLVFNLFAETITRAPTLILEQPNLVKKVVFPLEILPWVSMSAALFQFAIGIIILLATQTIFRSLPSAHAILGVFYIVSFIPLLIGLMYWLSALAVFIRDINQIITITVTLMLFLSPVFYPISALSENLQFWMWLNPLTSVIEGLRMTDLASQYPGWGALSVFMTVSIGIALSGIWFFHATRKFFADVV